jgi:Mg2+-importing ATPase
MSTPVPEKGKKSDKPFHIIPENELFEKLGTTVQGLTSQQADAHREMFGPNTISTKRKRPVLLQFLDHFRNLLVIILLIAAAISVFVGEFTNATIIFIIVLVSVTLDFFQEYKAGNAAELLNKKIISKVSVFRDAKQIELSITEIVPGDRVSLAAGNIVPR